LGRTVERSSTNTQLLSVLIKDGGQTEVSYLRLEVYFGEIYCLKESLLIVTTHFQKLRIVGEIQDNVS
jgi:hypothetical protein